MSEQRECQYKDHDWAPMADPKDGTMLDKDVCLICGVQREIDVPVARRPRALTPSEIEALLNGEWPESLKDRMPGAAQAAPQKESS